MPNQSPIKFINNRSLTHERIFRYYKNLVEVLDSYAIVINEESEVDKLFENPFHIINNYALVVIDAWLIRKNYDWNAFVNKIFTYPEKEKQNCNILIITQHQLSKSTMRSKSIKIIDID